MAPLFEQHFDFSTIPFRKDIPPLALFQSRAHQELVARLVQAIPRAEIMCVTGDIRAGKSTALRAAQHNLSPALYRFIYVPNPNMAARDLYQELLRELGVQPPWSTTNARRQLRDAFQALREDGRTPVVILDEAHKIPPGFFDELRILTLCRVADYAELVTAEGKTERPSGQALGIIGEPQERQVVCREDEFGGNFIILCPRPRIQNPALGTMTNAKKLVHLVPCVHLLPVTHANSHRS